MVASQQQLLRKQNSFNLSTSPNSSMVEGKSSTTPNTPTTIHETPLERNNSTEYVVIDSDPRVPDDSNATSTQVNGQEKKPKRDSSDVFAPDSPRTSKVIRPKKTRRSNPSSSWLGLINPSYKTRAEEFGKLFDTSIPSTERLVVDYSCALQKVCSVDPCKQKRRRISIPFYNVTHYLYYLFIPVFVFDIILNH